MDDFRTRLADHAILALDTSVFIYQFESHPRYMPLVSTVLGQIQSGHNHGVTSVIALMELTVHPWRHGRSTVAREYEVLLANFPNLTMLDVDRDIARQAAQLRARYNVQPADALHAATAICHKASGLVTNDRRLERLRELIDIIVLDRFVPQM